MWTPTLSLQLISIRSIFFFLSANSNSSFSFPYFCPTFFSCCRFLRPPSPNRVPPRLWRGFFFPNLCFANAHGQFIQSPFVFGFPPLFFPQCNACISPPHRSHLRSSFFSSSRLCDLLLRVRVTFFHKIWVLTCHSPASSFVYHPFLFFLLLRAFFFSLRLYGFFFFFFLFCSVPFCCAVLFPPLYLTLSFSDYAEPFPLLFVYFFMFIFHTFFPFPALPPPLFSVRFATRVPLRLTIRASVVTLFFFSVENSKGLWYQMIF